MIELGRGDRLVGVTHECDAPGLPDGVARLTRSRIASTADSAAIDRAVREEGAGLYELDEAGLSAARPDLILTQGQCEVCAVGERLVRRVAAGLPGPPRVVSVEPLDLDGILGMFRTVGSLLDASEEAEALVDRFEATAREVRNLRAGRPIPGVVHLEWFDPPFTSGHWNPELIAMAGGRELLGEAGRSSRRATWDEVRAARPDAILLAPCGFDLERAIEEAVVLKSVEGWGELPAVRDNRVFVADGSAYFSRPGPGIVTSLQIAAAAIDPERCGHLAAPNCLRRLNV